MNEHRNKGITVKLLPLLLIAMSVQVSSAAPPELVLIVTDKGYAWMTQDENGEVAVFKFSQVIVLGKPSGPLPQPTPGFGLEAPIRKLVAGLSESGKADLPAVRKGITDTAGMIAADKLKTLGEVEAVTSALLKAAIKDKVSWAPIAIAIDEALVKLQADKRIVTPADYGKALAEIARAMH